MLIVLLGDKYISRHAITHLKVSNLSKFDIYQRALETDLLNHQFKPSGPYYLCQVLSGTKLACIVFLQYL